MRLKKIVCRIALCLTAALLLSGCASTAASIENFIDRVESIGPPPVVNPGMTPEPTASPALPRETPKPDASAKPKETAAPEETPAPTPEPSPEPSPTPRTNITVTVEPTPAPEPESTPKPTPTPVPTPKPTPKPTPMPTPTPKPEREPIYAVSSGNTQAQETVSVPVPTPKPAPEPTPEPAPEPASKPSEGEYADNPQGATGQDIADLALSFVGCKYTYAGTSPETGFDCSGLVYYCYGQYGISMYRVAGDQALNGKSVSIDSLRPGDVLLFYNWKNGTAIGHSGIYVGDGQYVHAQGEATGVVISDLAKRTDTKYIARRIIK